MSHENVISFVSTRKITYKTRYNKVQYLISQFFMQNDSPVGSSKSAFLFKKEIK